MPIITYGIFLPNGRFLPNKGDGHAKNAKRFVEEFADLNKLMKESIYNADEFLICAGCGIVAGYRGERCFKVATGNVSESIKELTRIYKKNDYAIWPYWTIDETSEGVLRDIILGMPKMELILKEEI